MLATLIRLLGDFELAEEALHDAFGIAVEQWPLTGIPSNPRAWLVSTGRFKAIDSLRRKTRLRDSLKELTEQTQNAQLSLSDFSELNEQVCADDQLRLIFTCCHPAIAPDAQIALTLREVCGLTTEEIARAFLTSAPTVAQRIVRAKAKIRDARIPYQIPEANDIQDRLDTVLHVIYLVFNEGYAATSGPAYLRTDLCSEAIRLGRLLVALLPDPEVIGLLALMLLHDARRQSRVDTNGELVLLEDQNREVWNREQIDEGLTLVRQVFETRRLGPYSIQAAIAAVHAEAKTPQDTDWAEIAGLYELLIRITPSAILELNRAVAIAMRDSPQDGLTLIDAILERGDLADYALAHAARAELCHRIGIEDQARASYLRALELTTQEPQRQHIKKRLKELNKRAPGNT